MPKVPRTKSVISVSVSFSWVGIAPSQPPGSLNTATSPRSSGITSGAKTLTMIRSLISRVSSIEPDGMKKLRMRKALMTTESTSAVPTMTVKSIRKLRKAFFRARLNDLRQRAERELLRGLRLPENDITPSLVRRSLASRESWQPCREGYEGSRALPCERLPWKPARSSRELGCVLGRYAQRRPGKRPCER